MRTLSNGRRQYGLQCSECGQWQAVSAATRRTFATVREYDESINTRYWQKRNEQYQEVWAQRKLERQAAYYARFEEPDWQIKRRRVFERDEGRCLARLEGCRVNASQVHHLSYDHFGTEPLWDLASVCVPCHDQITAIDRERRGSSLE